MNKSSLIRQFAEIIAKSQTFTVLTGAGVSKESGVPTFRDAMDGLWAKYDPTQLATPDAFRRDPKLVWDWYMYRRSLVSQATPNAGHYALAELEDLLSHVVIITQNVDGFHQLAGSTDVICLHGDINRNKCFNNCQGNPTLIDLATLVDWQADAGPPLCPHCKKAYVRPDVVWFQESLPHQEIQRADLLSRSTDVILVVGTSGAVYPANMIPIVAKQSGATVLEINPQASMLTDSVDILLAAPSGDVLPQIVQQIRQIKHS